MAYTAPRTWATSEVLTAALLNTHLRDNLDTLRKMNDYACSLRFSTASGPQIANSDFVALTWEHANYNIGSIWASSSGRDLNARITGYYHLHGITSFDTNSSGRRGTFWFALGDTAVTFDLGMVPAAAGGPTVMSYADEIYLTSGAFIRIGAFQNSGANLQLNWAEDGSRVLWRLAGTTGN